MTLASIRRSLVIAGLALVVCVDTGASAAYRLLPVDVLFRDPTTYAYRLSPDAELLAAYLNLPAGRQLVLMDTNDSEPKSLFNFSEMPDIRFRDFGWIDGDTLYIEFLDKRDRDRLAFADIVSDDGEQRIDVKRVANVGKIVDTLPEQRDMLLFARETDKDDGKYRLYTISVDQLEVGNFRRATEFSNPLTGALSYRRDPVSGGLLAVTAGEETVQHWFLDAGAEDWVRLAEHDPRDVNFWVLAVTGEGRALVFSDELTNLTTLMEFDIERQLLGEVIYQHPRYDLTDASVSSRTGELTSVSYTDHGINVTEYMAETDAELQALLERRFPGRQARIVSGHESSSKKVVLLFTPEDPGEYYLLDTATLEAELLTPRFDGLDAYQLAASEVFTVTTDDGQLVEAIVTRPQVPNGVLLVNPHGGPVGVRDYASFDRETQFYADRGYTVLRVNFRGSRGFGREFMDTGRGQFGQRIEDDISAAVTQLLSGESFEHVCAAGASYGGYSAMMLAIRQPELYRCVVGRYGVYDLPYLYNTSNASQLAEYRDALARVVGEYSDSLADVSPLYLAESLRAPVLLTAGTDDWVVDYEHSNRLKYRLRQLGKPVEIFYYDGAGHGHQDWRGDRHEHALIDDFLRRTLRLPLPEASNQQQVLGEEYYRLASWFSKSTHDDHDDALVLRYLRQATEFEYAPALNWLGSLYERGGGVEQDFAQAVAYYRRAADGDNASANFRLGELHRDSRMGEFAAVDDAARAYEFFTRSHELGHRYAGFEMARALCTGTGIERDVDRCLGLLEVSPDTDENVKRRRDGVLAELTWGDSLATDVHARVTDFARVATGSTYGNVTVYLRERGLRADFGEWQDEPIPARIGNRFGIEVGVRHMLSDDNLGRRYAVLVRWTDPGRDEDGEPGTLYSIAYLAPGGQTSLQRRFDDAASLLPGQWRIEVATLDGELLIDERFTVID